MSLHQEPFWHAVISTRAPVIDKAIRRLDVAEEYADKARENYPDATDIEVVPLFRDAGARAGDGKTLTVPDGLARSDAEFWLRHRGVIIDALRADGLSIVSTANGVQLMRLGKAEAQVAAAPAAAPAGHKLLEDGKTLIPEDWAPLRMEWEPGYPEDVAFGPARLMERLKKWLDAHFEARRIAQYRASLPVVEAGALGAVQAPAAPAWQPIETAPLDVLVWVSATKRMSGPCIAMHHSRDGWVIETPSEWVSIYTPKHWMPHTPPAGPGEIPSPATVSGSQP